MQQIDLGHYLFRQLLFMNDGRYRTKPKKS